MRVDYICPAVDLADHLTSLDHAEVVRQLTNEYAKQVLCQRDRLYVGKE